MSVERLGNDLSVPKAILFDWDGTLVDTHPALASAMNVTLEFFGKEPWTFQQWSDWLGQSARDAFPKVFGDDWQQARKIYFDAYNEKHLETLAPIAGADTLVETLAALPLFLGVVSNKSGPFLRKEVSHLRWDGHFGHLVGGGDSARDKPAPDPVHEILAHADHDSGPHVWFIGDNDVDVMCGKSADCTTILIGNGYPDTQPDCRVESLEAVQILIFGALERA